MIIVLFVLFADQTQRTWIISAWLLGALFVFIIYLFNTLTIDGTAAALTVGVVAMGLGSWTGALLILFFFGTSYGLSSWLDRNEVHASNTEPVAERRSGIQVWANVFWFVTFLTAYFIYLEPWLQICAAAAIAAATSDTWSSIIGTRLSKNTRMITNFDSVPAGTDGAISLPGTLAGAAGAVSIAIIYIITGLISGTWELWDGVVIFICGFFGGIADSILGALVQYHNFISVRVSKAEKHGLLQMSSKLIPCNDKVNFMATGTAALLALLLY
ncbi:MAG: DUF92 domain-containing protein [Balneolales bacterium]